MVEAGKSYLVFNSFLILYTQLITGDEGWFCKKDIPAKVEGSKKIKNLCLWTSQCNWRAKKRWMCIFSPRIRQNIKKFNESQTFFFGLNPFFGTIQLNFFSFFYDICTLRRRVTQCLSKLSKILIFFENVVFLEGLFFGWKVLFSKESLRNLQIKIFSHVHNISPLTFLFYISCMKKLSSCAVLDSQTYEQSFKTDLKSSGALIGSNLKTE